MDKFFREVRTQLYFSRDDNINFATHIHDDLELVYVIRGGGTAYCDGKAYTLSPGDIFLVFPEQIHSYINCPDGEYILVVVSPSRLLYLEEFLRSKIPTSPLCTCTPALEKILCDALAEFKAKSERYIVSGFLTAFLGKLFQTLQFQQRSDFSDTVSNILQYCTQYYLQPISTQDLCRQFHLSQSYISHIFSQRLKISFPDYINSLRLNHAVTLLNTPGINMTQVAGRSGFPTIRTFNRVFQKQFGCSPSQYRMRHKKKQ